MPNENTNLHAPKESDLLAAAFNSTESVRFIVSKDGTILAFNRKAFENASLLHGKSLKRGDSLFTYANDPANEVENALRKDCERAFKGETFIKENEIHYASESVGFNQNLFRSYLI
ncbi:MAG: hypothetical protein K0R26_2309 [Bacteroidota bacterium]|jgi:hypothetical protein|nr:hypothetical protein [Bacteroidota bacterium]